MSGDPHLVFAHGGRADFRGRNGTYYSLLSAPGVQFAARSVDVDFIMQKGSFLRNKELTSKSLFVHGSFFSQVAWTVRGASGRMYGISSDANAVAFDVSALGEHGLDPHAFGGLDLDVTEDGLDLDGNVETSKTAHVEGAWKRWSQDGVRAYYKQNTLYVRANGWEVNATRQPVYNYVGGATKWRFDVAMRKLDDTPLAKEFGTASKTCFPHGLVGQSWDGDEIGVSGKQDEYKKETLERLAYSANSAHLAVATQAVRTYETMTTKAMAEGAIEGVGDEYTIHSAHHTAFKYSRFDMKADAVCAPRDVSKLTGRKFAADAKQLSTVAGANDADAGVAATDADEDATPWVEA